MSNCKKRERRIASVHIAGKPPTWQDVVITETHIVRLTTLRDVRPMLKNSIERTSETLINAISKINESFK